MDVINNWWGGRQMTHLLPRFFFEHFQSTSFIVEDVFSYGTSTL